MAEARRVKAGIVGCGDISLHGYFPYVSRIFDLVATCDLIEERARQMARIWGAREVYTSLDDMLAKSDIEAVFVLTPMSTHADLTLKVAQAGKHFLVQKPFTTNFEKGKEVVRVARQKGVKGLVEPNYWLDPVYQKAKQIIQEGHIGQVHYILARTERDFVPLWGGETYYEREGGGMLFDMGVYLISGLTYLLGPAKKVVGLAALSVPQRPPRWSDDVFTDFLKTYNVGDSPFAYRAEQERLVPTEMKAPDNTFTLIEWPGNCLGCVVANSVCFVMPPQGPRMFLCGEKGTIAFGIPDSGSPLSVASTIENSPYFVPKPQRGKEWHHLPRESFGTWRYMEGSTQHLHDCIVNNTEPLPSIEWGLHVSEIMIKSFESSEKGQALALETTF